jgi:PadR family transcriptional regulator PadR
MAARLRLSRQTVQLLEAFLEAPTEWRYGYDISRDTGLKSGTLYPILMRLAGHKLLETCWESTEAGRPPRHMYRLTASGLRQARECVRARSTGSRQRAALGGARMSGAKN